MSLEKSGFLGQRAKEFPAEFRREHLQYFDFVDRANSALHRTKMKLGTANFERRHLVSGAVFIRIVNSFAACIILLERGMITDAEVVARSFIEAVMLLGAFAKERAFAEKYAQSHEAERLAAVEKVIKKKDRYKDVGIDDSELAKMQQELLGVVKGKIGTISAELKATTAGLEPLYDYAFTHFSNSVHVAPLSLKRFIVLDEKDIFKALHGGPWSNEIPKVMRAVLTGACIANMSAMAIFEIKDDEAEALATDWTEFSKVKSSEKESDVSLPG